MSGERGYMPPSKSDSWTTPRPLFDGLNEEFDFTADAAASRENALCPRFITKTDNGLGPTAWRHLLGGPGQHIWLNPPYSDGLDGQFVERAWRESQQDGHTVVCLVYSKTELGWWHRFVMQAAYEVRFIQGRLTFGGADASAPRPSCLIVFKPGIWTPVYRSCDRLGRLIAFDEDRQLALPGVAAA